MVTRIVNYVVTSVVSPVVTREVTGVVTWIVTPYTVPPLTVNDALRVDNHEVRTKNGLNATLVISILSEND